MILVYYSKYGYNTYKIQKRWKYGYDAYLKKYKLSNLKRILLRVGLVETSLLCSKSGTIDQLNSNEVVIMSMREETT